MRQLLMAALSAAGLLMTAQTALAQTSITTSTFSGEIAANCEFSDLADNYTLDYSSTYNNLISARHRFELTANSSTVRIHVSPVIAIIEPPPNLHSIKPRVTVDDPHLNDVWGEKDTDGVMTYNVDTLGPNYFYIRMLVSTSYLNGKMDLPPGQYSYRATISCLQ